jgi:hypothetical protein
MAVEITGSGYNSKVKLYNIHQGNGYFRKDTSTTHSQVKLLQSALTDLGYDTQGQMASMATTRLPQLRNFRRQTI